MHKFRWLPLLLMSLNLLLPAGCGQGPNPTPTQVPVPTLGVPVDMTSSQQVTIKIINTNTNPDGYWYDQPSIKIKVETIVTWTNLSSGLHTVTSGQPGAPDGRFDSGTGNLLQPGNKGASSTFSFTFTKPGSYAYFCQLHPAMIGLVQVVS